MKYRHLIFLFFLLFLILSCAKDTASIVQAEISSSSFVGIMPSDLGSISDTIAYYEQLLIEEDNPANQQLIRQIIEDNKAELEAQSVAYIEQQKMAVADAETTLAQLKETGASEVEIIAAEEAVAEAKGALTTAENEYGDPVFNEASHLMSAAELEGIKDSIDMFEQLKVDIPENQEAYDKVVARLEAKLEQQSIEYVQQRDSVVKAIEAEIQLLQESNAAESEIAAAQERLGAAQNFKDAAKSLVVGLVPDIELPNESSQEVSVSSSSVLQVSSSQSSVSSNEINVESSATMTSSVAMVSSAIISSALELSSSIGTFSSVVQVSSVVSSSSGVLSSSSVNSAPTFSQADTLIKVIDEDSTLTVLLNASDADGDVLTWVLDSASNGSATIDASGNDRTVTYVPTLNYNGTDQITILVSDGTLDATVTINITMSAVDDPADYSGTPTIAGTMQVGSQLNIVAGECIDPDGARTYVYEWYRDIDGVGDDGVLIAGQTDSLYTVTSDDGVKFIYAKVSCNGGVAKVTSHSSEINVAPVISPNVTEVLASISEDDDGSGFFLGVISATDLNTTGNLIWSVSDSSSNGIDTASGVTNPYIKYVPNANFFGADTFTVQVSDAYLTDQIDVIVIVSGVNDDPVYNGTPTISGSENVNEELTVEANGSCIDVDAVTGLGTLSYVWSRYDNVSGGGEATIGTNASTYTLTGIEQGKYVKVAVTCTGLHGTPVTTSTNYSGAVGAAIQAVVINSFNNNSQVLTSEGLTMIVDGADQYETAGGTYHYWHEHTSPTSTVTMNVPSLAGMTVIHWTLSQYDGMENWFNIKAFDGSTWVSVDLETYGNIADLNSITTETTIIIPISAFGFSAADIQKIELEHNGNAITNSQSRMYNIEARNF